MTMGSEASSLSTPVPLLRFLRLCPCPASSPRLLRPRPCPDSSRLLLCLHSRLRPGSTLAIRRFFLERRHPMEDTRLLNEATLFGSDWEDTLGKKRFFASSYRFSTLGKALFLLSHVSPVFLWRARGGGRFIAVDSEHTNFRLRCLHTHMHT